MRRLLLILAVLFCATSSFGQTDNTIKLAAGLRVEPYIIEATDSGFEADIVREAFAAEGYRVAFVYQPLLRTKKSFANHLVDGVLTIKSHYPEVKGAFLSDEYITYHNVAVTLAARNIKIDRVADLQDKTICAFQQANLALGSEFATIAKNNPKYTEMANQDGQVAMLFFKRNDGIVLDKRIFLYYRKKLKDSAKALEKASPFEEPVAYHYIFEPSNYRIAFKNEKLRDSFNAGLKKLRETGRYEKIIETYVPE